MQLVATRAAAVAAAAIAAWPTPARGDGEVTLRGAYYKERSTRVAQPMLDATFDVGDTGTADAHFLVDAITSASAAAGASGSSFTEQRIEAGLGYFHRLAKLGVGGGFRISDEPDYKSRFASVRGTTDLAQNNTTLALALAAGNDDISNASAQGAVMSPFSGDLTTLLGSISIGQVLSPVLVASATYDLIVLDGFQANPYRLVPAGGNLERERVPDRRYRNAVFGSVRGFVEATRTVVIGGYRFYADDWGIYGHTPELRAVQEIVPQLDVHARYRFHHQNAAEFFRAVYDTADPEVEPFLTSDVKLGRMNTHTIGVKVEGALGVLGITGRFAAVRTEVLFEYIIQDTSFGDAVSAQAALTLPFDY